MNDGVGESEAAKPGPWGHREAAAAPVQTPPRPPRAPRKPIDSKNLLMNLASTALTAAVLYLLTNDWIWVLALIVTLAVHEIGHVLMMNGVGCGPASFRITPFFGGVATSAISPPTEFKGVLIALAGPVFGLLASLPFFGLFYATGDNHWLVGAFLVGALNLLNLVPAPPLDGSKAIGPVLARIHPLVERGVVIVLGAIAIAWALWQHQWFILPVLVLGLMGLVRASSLRPWALRLTNGETATSVALYALAIAMCFGVIWAVAYLFGLGDQPLELIAYFLNPK
jgi:Zn-dependent protease